MSPHLGFIWNSQLNDFTANENFDIKKQQYSEGNIIRAGKKPMSSMSPTVVYNRKTGKVALSFSFSIFQTIITNAIAATRAHQLDMLISGHPDWFF